MSRPQKRATTPTSEALPSLGRITRPISLTAQVEQVLRQAIADGRWANGRLPTAVELAEQLGVSRETVRLAAETLQREGLLVKIRRKGTFTQPPPGPLVLKPTESKLLGYVQVYYQTTGGQKEEALHAISGLMLQGASAEASQAGFRLVLQHTPQTHLRESFTQLYQHTPLRGVIFASYGEEKLLRRVVGLGLPVLLLDHDLFLPRVNSVRDDSFEDALQAVRYLASLGHRRIAFAHWHQAELNPWRLRGYRQGLRDANLPRQRRWEIL